MAAIDDILGGGSGYAGMRKPLQVSPSAIDPSMPGAPNTVGSQPATQSPKPAIASQSQGAAIASQSQGPAIASQAQGPAATQLMQVPGTDATKIVGKPGEALQPLQKRGMSYVEMFRMFNPDRPETAEEKARREKREKGEAALAAVGDSISALSNLWFTSQYAPNAYDPSKGMSATTKNRWDKLRQEREAKNREYYEGYLRARSMDEAKEREDRSWRHTLDREKVLDARADKKEEREERKAEQNELMFQLKYALQEGKLTEQGYRTAIAEVKAGTIKELTEAHINRLNRSGTGSGGRGGRGRAPGEYPWYDKDGNLHYAHDYQAMRQNALLHGTWNEEMQESASTRVTRTSQGTVKSTTETTNKRPGKGYSSAPGKKEESKGEKPKSDGKGKNNWSNTKGIKW